MFLLDLLTFKQGGLTMGLRVPSPSALLGLPCSSGEQGRGEQLLARPEAPMGSNSLRAVVRQRAEVGVRGYEGAGKNLVLQTETKGMDTQRGLEAETGPQELCLWSFLVAGLRREFVAYIAAGVNPKPRLFVMVLSKVE